MNLTIKELKLLNKVIIKKAKATRGDDESFAILIRLSSKIQGALKRKEREQKEQG